MTPDQIIAERIEAHRQRVQAELARQNKIVATKVARGTFKPRFDKRKLRRKSWTQRWLEKIDRLNLMAANPGYST